MVSIGTDASSAHRNLGPRCSRTQRITDEYEPSNPSAETISKSDFANNFGFPTNYDAHLIENSYHHLTILAYEMNGETLDITHSAPLRLRDENELGFKQVKWVRAIELVDSFAHLGAGHAATTRTRSSTATGCRSEADIASAPRG